MISAIWQLPEKCQEQHVNFYTTFIDRTKAFDTVWKEVLWKIMKKYRCPEKLTCTVWEFHDDMKVHVVDNGILPDSFPSTNLVKQGCVFAPDLFSFMFSAVLWDAHRQETHGDFWQHADGKVFDLQCLQTITFILHSAAIVNQLFAVLMLLHFWVCQETINFPPS